MKECNINKNMESCNCSYSCSRKGQCCECIRYHRQAGELPACYFNAEFEKTYDRSVENYLKMLSKR
ncbi:MAG TPA: DUF6485 family protein [Candidatus Cloacimonadota bacterium]|nr:DUF6485 family protein [Candidatus Cloacimonadota bacterium]HQL15376.1 DUF6485 family protein [Candidatus Cloacimonadota bacterium]